MEWNIKYNQDNQPTPDQIGNFIDSELWEKLNSYMQSTFSISPKFSYSHCSMQPGWNVKYQKSGKSLCTLYPMPRYFIALIVIGNKEIDETEVTLPFFCEYTQNLYQNTVFSAGGRWLMINVTEPEILDDVINLIKIRVRSNNIRFLTPVSVEV